MMTRTKSMSFIYALAIREGDSQNNLLILLDLHLGHRRLLLWQHQCWGHEIVSIEADVQIISF